MSDRPISNTGDDSNAPNNSNNGGSRGPTGDNFNNGANTNNTSRAGVNNLNNGGTRPSGVNNSNNRGTRPPGVNNLNTGGTRPLPNSSTQQNLNGSVQSPQANPLTNGGQTSGVPSSTMFNFNSAIPQFPGASPNLNGLQVFGTSQGNTKPTQVGGSQAWVPSDADIQVLKAKVAEKRQINSKLESDNRARILEIWPTGYVVMEGGIVRRDPEVTKAVVGQAVEHAKHTGTNEETDHESGALISGLARATRATLGLYNTFSDQTEFDQSRAIIAKTVNDKAEDDQVLKDFDFERFVDPSAQH
ncbi:hypothetical protein E4T42_08019 [Aureobasidium subglaciale]|nr:hypothetical protein E4T42_08019 [Aureobasidium subglaciale]